MAIVFYGYEKCSTCRKAKQWLNARGVEFEERDITTRPPTKAELAAIAAREYSLGDLFNRSGQLYRDLGMKDRLKTLTCDAALDLLARHGKLIKRPIITDGRRWTVGFDEARFRQVWLA